MTHVKMMTHNTMDQKEQSSERALGSRSVSAWREPVQEPPRWTLVSHVTTATAVVADHEGATHAVTAHMANLVAGPADHVTVATTEESTTATAEGSIATTEGSITTAEQSITATEQSIAATEGRRPTPLVDLVRFGALTGQMPCNMAEVANRLIGAVTGKMATLPTVVAGLLVGALHGNVPWFVAVVAELHFSRQHWRSSAVFCNVA